MGAKKIYGLDISEEMINQAREELTALKIIDKFELLTADFFDKNLKLPEKVDYIVHSYTITTFVNNFEMLKDIMVSSGNHVKPDTGIVYIADFSYVKMEQDNWWAEMYTKTMKPGVPPKPFETFNWLIKEVPDHHFEIFNIPSKTMIEAGEAAGLELVSKKTQYPDPNYENDPMVLRYVDTCNPDDYLIKFKVKS